MKYLLDTNAWLGFLEGRRDFGRRAKATMLDEFWECRISIASLWEAAIKLAMDKLRLPYDLDRDLPGILDANGFELLPLEFEDVTGVRNLESLHGDPFDRIQVVQARRRGLRVISRDPVFEDYGLRRIW